MYARQNVTMRQETVRKREEIKTALIGNVFIWSLIFFGGFVEGLMLYMDFRIRFVRNYRIR